MFPPSYYHNGFVTTHELGYKKNFVFKVSSLEQILRICHNFW